MHQNTDSVPNWVRILVVIAGCLSIPLMVCAEIFGTELSPYVAFAVVAFAITTSCFAFNRDVPSSVSRFFFSNDKE
jgi:hypothetical protein